MLLLSSCAKFEKEANNVSDMVSLKDEVLSTFHKFQERLDTVEKGLKAGVRTPADIPAEEVPAFERMNQKLDAAMAEIKRLHAAANRPETPPVNIEESPEHPVTTKGLLGRWLKRGFEGFTPAELTLTNYNYMPAEKKALYSNDQTTGGFFITPDRVNELLRNITLINEFRSVARARTTSSDSVQLPTREKGTTVTWAMEKEAYTESQDPAFGMREIFTRELRALLKISDKDLEDPDYDLESFLMEEMAEAFAVAEGLAFIKGSGVKQPEGIMTNSEIAFDVSGVAADISSDMFITCMHNLKAPYRRNGTWLMNTRTLGKIRLLKDDQSRPLWQPFAAGGLPSTIYDRPYVEMDDMDDVAAGNFPVFFGDFRRGYLIVDRLGMTMKRLEELYAADGLIGYRARRRVGGAVILPEAIRKIKIAAS
jgi:HK97 family phage major capsid protein